MSTSRDYAHLDPRSFRQWLRTRLHTRIEPERSVLHPELAPKPNASEDARLARHSEHVWRMARLGR